MSKDEIIERASQSATLAVMARLCIVLTGVVFVPIAGYLLVDAWKKVQSIPQLEFEQRYQSLRLHNIEKELKLEAPARWWDRSLLPVPPAGEPS